MYKEATIIMVSLTYSIYRQSLVKQPYLKNFKQITFHFKYDKSSPPQGKELR